MSEFYGLRKSKCSYNSAGQCSALSESGTTQAWQGGPFTSSSRRTVGVNHCGFSSGGGVKHRGQCWDDRASLSSPSLTVRT